MAEDLPAVFRTAEALSSLPVLVRQVREVAEQLSCFNSFPGPLARSMRGNMLGASPTESSPSPTPQ